MREGFTQAAIQGVETDAAAGDAEEFGQGGGRQPAEGAAFAARFDEAADGDQGGEGGQRHARAGAGQEAFEEALEAEQLPGAKANVNVAEAARVAPGDRAGIDHGTSDGTAGVPRRPIAD